jgi:alcohol dehydrogenase
MDRIFKALESAKGENQHSLNIVDKTIDDLPEGPLLINVEYSSLNYKDAMSASGLPGVTRNYPHVPGIDAAGVVVKSDDSKFSEGDKVIVTGYDLGMNTSGGFSEFIRIPSEWAVPLPSGLTTKEAMIIGTAGLTAGLSVLALETLNGIPNTKSIVSGATGGVGSIAVKLLSMLGSQVTAITGKDDQADLLVSLGAEEVLNRNEFLETHRRPMGKNFWDHGVDVVGGDILPTMIGALNPGGAIACSGLVGGPGFEASVLPFILRGVSLLGIDSVEIPLSQKAEVWNRFASDWSISLEGMYKEVSLDQLESEIKTILNGGQVGRVLVKI